MNSAYAVIIAVIFCGALLGCILGGIRIIILSFHLLVATLTTWYLFQAVASVFIHHGSIQAIWAYTIASCIIFSTTLTTTYWLHSFFLKFAIHTHKNIYNKIIGLLMGAIVSVAGLVLGIEYNKVPMPEAARPYIQSVNLKATINDPLQHVITTLNELPIGDETKVMAVNAQGVYESAKEECVVLSFSTNLHTYRPDLEHQMLELINMERDKLHLTYLILDTALTRAARMHTADMLSRSYFSHTTPEGIDPFQRLRRLNITYYYAGENLALAPTLFKAHEGLMKSPGHRANIIKSKYGRVGIGVIDAGVYGLMVTQEFRD